MRFACWVTKATNTHAEHETFIGFLLQQRCHEAPQCYIVRPLLYLNRMFCTYQETRGGVSGL